MRDIQDILNELMAHPEYLHHEIFTRRDARRWIMSDYKLLDTESNILDGVLIEEDYSEIADFFYNVGEYSFTNAAFDYPPEMDKRIKRAIKIDSLLGQSDSNDTDML